MSLLAWRSSIQSFKWLEAKPKSFDEKQMGERTEQASFQLASETKD